MEPQILCACGTPIAISGVPPGTSVPCPGCGKPFYRAGRREEPVGALPTVAMVLGLIPCTGLLGLILGVVAVCRGGGSRAWTGAVAGLFWSILAVVGAIVVPRLGPDPRVANETSALDAVNRIGIAQHNYYTSYSTEGDPKARPHFWFFDVAGLHYAPNPAGQNLNLIPRTLADADATDPGRWPGQPNPPRPYSGYLVRRVDVEGEGFAVCAYPVEYGVTGTLTFIRNDKGLTYARDTGGSPPAAWPTNPVGEGWLAR